MNSEYIPHRGLLALLGVLVLVATPVWFRGCGYPEVSPRTYEISRALYSACNLRDESRLQKVREVTDTSLQAGDISEREAGWLTEIIQQAQAGEWEAACQQTRRIMADQIDL